MGRLWCRCPRILITKQKENKMKSYHLEFNHYDNYRGGGCTVRVNGTANRSCNAGGCGYDRQGAAFGNFVTLYFESELLEKFRPELDSLPEPTKEKPYSSVGRDDLSGLRIAKEWHKGKVSERVSVDGACGFDEVRRLLNHLGYRVSYLSGSKLSSHYFIAPLPEGMKD